MSLQLFFFIAVFTIIPLNAFAHGENKPGPNRGFIRMPGAFHTELVPEHDSSFKLFLLDINFQNPSVKDSFVEVTLVDTEERANCEVKKDHYFCKFKTPGTLKRKRSLRVKSMRGGVKGSDVTYELPLL